MAPALPTERRKMYWLCRGNCLPFHYVTLAIHSLVFCHSGGGRVHCHAKEALQYVCHWCYRSTWKHLVVKFTQIFSSKVKSVMGTSCSSCKSAYCAEEVYFGNVFWCSNMISHYLKTNANRHLKSGWLVVSFRRMPNLQSLLNPAVPWFTKAASSMSETRSQCKKCQKLQFL